MQKLIVTLNYFKKIQALLHQLYQPNTTIKKEAFTLAEVLITLMVIGILAMITIPSLMQTFEKMTLKSQAKHALSILSQALYQATAEEDTKCYYSGDSGITVASSGCNLFYNSNFIKKLRVVNKCSGTYTMNGCIPDYGLPETIPCGWFSPSYTKDAYVLNDGIIIIMYGIGYSPVFWVDVNGIKPPNKPLQDLLGFKIYKKSTGGYYFDNSFKTCFSFTIENPTYFEDKSDLFN